jgi:hypothetical protein
VAQSASAPRLRDGVFEKKTPLGEQVNDDEENHRIRSGQRPAGSWDVCGSCGPRLSDRRDFNSSAASACRLGAAVTGQQPPVGHPTDGEWIWTATTQTMQGGTVLLTWGVVTRDTLLWIGKAHPLGDTMAQRAEARANAALLAASKQMATLLDEAVQAWAEQFDGSVVQAGDEERHSMGGLLGGPGRERAKR